MRRMLAEQGFTPEGMRGQTVFQVWEQEDDTFLMREVPFETVGWESVHDTMAEAIHAMKSLMVDRGYEPKGPPTRARQMAAMEAELAKNAGSGGPTRSRFDRDEVV